MTENTHSLPHQLCGFDFGSRSNHLGFTGTLALGSHGQRVLEFLAKDDVLDEHGLDLDTPAKRRLLDNLTNRLGNLLSALNHVLQDTRTNNMTQCRLGALDKRLADVADAKGGLVRRRNAVVNDRRQLQRDIVLCHADLLGHLDNLHLDVDLGELLRQRVHIDETGIHGAGKASELGDEPHVALVDGLVWIRADDAAGNRS